MPRRSNDTSSEGGPPKKKNCNASTMSSFALKHDEFLQDITGKQWKLGKPVGVGGFGEIYLASDNLSKEVKTDSLYVAKVESHKNGPLFVEVNCYLRIARAVMIEEWKKQNRVDSLGMPHYVASGSHMHRGERYRFLILPKFDKDLEQILQNKKLFNIKTVLTISLQIIDVLEYIHSKGYIHSDIKASNILLGSKTVKNSDITTPKRSSRIRNRVIVNKSKRKISNRNLRPLSCIDYGEGISDFSDKDYGEKDSIDQVYLLDYGLASKFLTSRGDHKPFCVDERKAHAGTILFCSRDAHKGVQSRRSDLESLGYNMIYWLTGNLPWSNDVDNPEIVAKKKQKSMNHIEYFLQTCFTEYPKFLFDYFKFLENLEFDEKPDYGYCRRLFKQSIKENGYKDDSLLDFENSQTCKIKIKKSDENNLLIRKNFARLARTPLQSNIPVKPLLRKKIKNKKLKNRVNWFEVTDPEEILKQGREKRNSENADSNLTTNVVEMDINSLNPTYAMIEVYNKCRERIDASLLHKGDSCIENKNGYTPAMMTVFSNMRKRKEMELEQLVVNLSNNKSGNVVKRGSKRKRKFESPARSPPQTRTSKSVTDLKKEQFQPRKIKSVAFRRTYSLRG